MHVLSQHKRSVVTIFSYVYSISARELFNRLFNQSSHKSLIFRLAYQFVITGGTFFNEKLVYLYKIILV